MFSKLVPMLWLHDVLKKIKKRLIINIMSLERIPSDHNAIKDYEIIAC